MLLYPGIKHTLDFLASLLMLLLLSWLLLLIWAVLLFFTSRPLFFQPRAGLFGQTFRIIKFRTLKEGSGEPSSFGRFLRKFSLDELPQLVNVFRGEMSFVGPRPLLPEYLSEYNIEQRKRHYARPGITGWAQVKGRNTLSWDEQFRLDVWYVENQSFTLDLKILFLTISKLLSPAAAELKEREPFSKG